MQIKLNSKDLKKTERIVAKIEHVKFNTLLYNNYSISSLLLSQLVSSLHPSQYHLLVKILGAVVKQSIRIHAPCSCC